MVKHFGAFFTDVWKSASDLRFYDEVGARPFRGAFLHLLKVALGFGTVLALVMVSQVVFLNGLWTWCRDNLPVITIRNGEASAAVTQPHLIERKAGEKGVFAVIIDTTGATEKVDPKYMMGILVKKREALFKVGEGTITRRFAGAGDVIIDRAYFSRLMIGYRRLSLYVAGLYPALLLALIAQAAAAALVGLAVSAARGAGFSYAALFKMSCYALALAVCVLIFAVIAGVGLHPWYILCLYGFVHLGFLTGAVLTAGGYERAA